MILQPNRLNQTSHLTNGTKFCLDEKANSSKNKQDLTFFNISLVCFEMQKASHSLPFYFSSRPLLSAQVCSVCSLEWSPRTGVASWGEPVKHLLWALHSCIILASTQSHSCLAFNFPSEVQPYMKIGVEWWRWGIWPLTYCCFNIKCGGERNRLEIKFNT